MEGDPVTAYGARLSVGNNLRSTRLQSTASSTSTAASASTPLQEGVITVDSDLEDEIDNNDSQMGVKTKGKGMEEKKPKVPPPNWTPALIKKLDTAVKNATGKAANGGIAWVQVAASMKLLKNQQVQLQWRKSKVKFNAPAATPKKAQKTPPVVLSSDEDSAEEEEEEEEEAEEMFVKQKGGKKKRKRYHYRKEMNHGGGNVVDENDLLIFQRTLESMDKSNEYGKEVMRLRMIKQMTKN